ncbi:mucin-13b [Pygocentrus nattereri]|uniref:mucin-13b n=1 Tax=Pygocentrus nattereri TaxID=42514 RepID=UPI0018914771|nr:mucin-13b [Pygocentrus nattereri]
MVPLKQLFIFCLIVTAAASAATSMTVTTSATTVYTSAPATVTSVPAAVTSDPAAVTSEPAAVTSDPAAVTSVPAAVTSNSATVTSDPAAVTSDPAAVTSDPAAVTSDPAAVTSNSAAVTSDPAAVTSNSATVTSDPATVTSNPATVTSNPATVTSDPATVTSDPATVTSDPATVTSDPVTATTTTIATTTLGPCGSNPCPQDSRCEEIFEGFRCLCRPGLFYNVEVNSCIRGKIFSFELTVNVNYTSGMEDDKTEIFKTTAEKIIVELNEAFMNQPGYRGSIVYSLKLRSVFADVESFFLASSDVTDNLVGQLLINATANSGHITDFTQIDTCTKNYCDEMTTTCDAKDGVISCICKAAYVASTEWSTERSCIACPSGQQAVNSKTCEACDFGYSGFNCDEYYLLAVVIISCVLGALLIAALVVIIVLSCRESKKSTQFSEDSMNFHKPVGIPRIPRANHNSDWEQADLEVTDSGSTHALVTKDQPENIAMEKYYDPYNYYTRGNSSQTHARNGYGNGYGSRGTRNPYYDPDEDRI